MIKVSLLTMPESVLAFPSIGLTQIASSLHTKYGDTVKVDIHYPCMDFASYIGLENYIQLQAASLNQWLFRNEAFPDADDCTNILKKYYLNTESSITKNKIFSLFLEKLDEIDGFLDYIIDKYSLLEYEIIGLSSSFAQNIPSFALARRIKQKKSSCIIVMGGPNCLYPMGKTIIDNIEAIDFVFSGPGIISFSKFIECLLKKDEKSIYKINGVFARKNNITDQEWHGKKYTNPIGDFHDINMCIDLNYDSFLTSFEQFQNKTGFPHKPILLLETSRGCWKLDALPCTFCGLNNTGNHYESMKSDLAVQYIQKYVDKYGDRCSILFCIDNILDKKYIIEVMPFLKIPSGLSIMYETSSTLTKAQMTVCANQGFNILQPGIESLNSSELSLMQKGITAFTNIQFLKHSIEVGIYPIWNYLYKVPGNASTSNYDKVAEFLPLVRHLPPPASLTPIVLDRFSTFFRDYEKYHLELVPSPHSFGIYPMDDSVINEFATSFIDINHNASYIKVADAYVQDINFEIIDWISAFRTEEDIPKLYYLNENSIFDSRFDIDEPIIHNITKLEKEILMYLEKPLTVEQLKSILDISKEDILEAFDSLEHKKLLFSENDRYINLVCSQCNFTKAGFEKQTDFTRLTTTATF